MGFLDGFKRKKAANKKKPKDSRQSSELVKKGSSLVKADKLDEAIATLNQAIDLDPDNALAHSILGIAYGRKGWRDKAITEYKRTIELDPNNANTHFSLACEYFYSRRFNLAWKHVRIAEKMGLPPRITTALFIELRKVSTEP